MCALAFAGTHLSPPVIAQGVVDGGTVAAFDVVVVGSEPEAIAAAVAAAESGASTMLVSDDARVGGLFTMGALTMLDLRLTPAPFQGGVFARWWQAVGGRYAFDPERAETVFEAMLDEAGVVWTTDASSIALVVDDGVVVGARWDGGEVRASYVVDGDADARHAVAAGASASFGWTDYFADVRMADTWTFRIDGIDWLDLRRGAARNGRSWAVVDDSVAWGHFGGVPASYPPTDPSMRLRGLNLGRDDAGAAWVNALLIYGMDPFDPTSVAEARLRATGEAHAIVDWLRTRLPGFDEATLGAMADAPYVRETWHLNAVCTVDANHVLDGIVGPFDVAYGGYPLDLQTLTPSDSGFVFGTPSGYGVPLCVTVPAEGPDRLFVVGRAAGYDPVAHASARVVPLGMAVAEAVGVAAAQWADLDRSTAASVVDRDLVEAVRGALVVRGAVLPPRSEDAPVGPVDHRAHDAYRLLLGRGLAVGGYDNDPALDEPTTALGHVYLLANVATRFSNRPDVARTLVDRFGGTEGPAYASTVATVHHEAACLLGLGCGDRATPEALWTVGLWPDEVATSGVLSRGDLYLLAERLVSQEPRTQAD